MAIRFRFGTIKRAPILVTRTCFEWFYKTVFIIIDVYALAVEINNRFSSNLLQTLALTRLLAKRIQSYLSYILIDFPKDYFRRKLPSI